jgi:cytosine/adenosine deaminase-related metal-dependent hydrolase
VHIHCNALGDDEWAMLARANAKVSISPETELNMGMGAPVFGKCRQFGIRPTLSCDIVSLNSGDLFTQMRLGLAYARFVDNDKINRSSAMPDQLSYSVRDALEWVTVNGAMACGLESKIGSLAPGKQADVVVLGGDSFTMRPRPETAGSVVFQAAAHDVRDVMIAGKLVKRGGRLVNVDLPRVLDRAEKSAGEILSRVNATAPSSLPATVANQFAALIRR